MFPTFTTDVINHNFLSAVPEHLRKQIRDMKAAGIGGFFMHARGGLLTEYMGEDWMKLIPINPQYPPMMIENEALEECSVLGVPRMVIREIV